MTASPDSLAPQFRNDPRVEPPYSNAQISEAAIHQEIVRIYQTARRETRDIYDLGRDQERPDEDNWVIRWMLWHVFRYRDNRNRNRRAGSPSSGGGGGGGDGAAGPSTEATSGSPPSLRKYCLHLLVSEEIIKAYGSRTDTTTSNQSRYYDPVRDV